MNKEGLLCKLFLVFVFKDNDVFGPFPPFPEDAMISRHFQTGAKLTLLQSGLGTAFFSVQNVPIFSIQKRESYVLFRSFPFFSRVFGDL